MVGISPSAWKIGPRAGTPVRAVDRPRSDQRRRRRTVRAIPRAAARAIDVVPGDGAPAARQPHFLSEAAGAELEGAGAPPRRFSFSASAFVMQRLPSRHVVDAGHERS